MGVPNDNGDKVEKEDIFDENNIINLFLTFFLNIGQTMKELID